jgi:putative transposase
MPWLGTWGNGTVTLTVAGEIVRREWLRTPALRQNVQVDEFVIMPNHFHGILVISSPNEATHRVAATTLVPGSLGSIVGQFKSAATREIRRSGDVAFGWQRNYYEHVIRNDFDLNDIRQYIVFNPGRWALDEENPDCR